jgi:hypothetical protein
MRDAIGSKMGFLVLEWTSGLDSFKLFFLEVLDYTWLVTKLNGTGWLVTKLNGTGADSEVCELFLTYMWALPLDSIPLPVTHETILFLILFYCRFDYRCCYSCGI